MPIKPKGRSLRIVLIALVIVVIMAIAVVLAFVFVPAGASRVSIKEASLSWEYNNFDKKYHVGAITAELTNNGRDQIFDLYIQVEGNWPVEYELEKGFDIRVGAGLNPGETRTISDSAFNNWNIHSATKQLGTYTVTLRVVKYKYNDPTVFHQVEDVYGERTITTHVP
jgi:hypothetical protein